MSYLLDTNVLSELTRPRPDNRVISWFERADENANFISVVTLAELRYGIARRSDDLQRRRLDSWVRQDVRRRFEGRILTVDAEIAELSGELAGERARRGRPLLPMDALLAATARVHGLTLVTRNTADFEGSVDSLLNPWREP